MAPATRRIVELPIATMASGARLSVPVHVVVGRRPGPRLVLIATQHGEELGPLSSLREILGRIDPEALAGTLVVIPVANPIAFEHQQRSTWIETNRGGSTGNLNRVWPGKARGFITERIAHELTTHVLRDADCVIDYHGSTVGGVSLYYAYMVPDDGTTLAQTTRDLALAFGMEILMMRSERQPGTGSSLSDYVYFDLKKPVIAAELGDFYGFAGDGRADRPAPVRTIPEVGVTGTLNVMRKLGMLQGDIELPKRQVIVSPETRCQPSHGGLLEAVVTRRDIGTVLAGGTVLGRVISPYTFETLDEIRAPYAQNLLVSASDSHPYQRVNPGDQGFHVADYATATWIENA
jgi:predicted deacylase